MEEECFKNSIQFVWRW